MAIKRILLFLAWVATLLLIGPSLLELARELCLGFTICRRLLSGGPK